MISGANRSSQNPPPIFQQPSVTSSITIRGGDAPGNLASASGDLALTQLYADALSRAASAPYYVNVENEAIAQIPTGSTYGQWQQHLKSLLSNGDFTGWARRNNIDLSKSIIFYPPPRSEPGFLVATVAGRSAQFGGKPGHDQLLPLSWSLLMEAASALAAGKFRLHTPMQDTATVEAIASFYGETLPDSKEGLKARATLLRSDIVFPQLTASDAGQRGKGAPDVQTTQLAEIHNRTAFYQAGRGEFLSKFADAYADAALNSELPAAHPDFLRADQFKVQVEQMLVSSLESTLFTVDVHSSYARRMGLAPGAQVSMKQFLEDSGIALPRTKGDVSRLLNSLMTAPPLQSSYADLGGALSWPIPPQPHQLTRLTSHIRASLVNVPGWVRTDPLDSSNRILDYLAKHQPWSENQLRNPRGMLETLLASPKAEALEKAFEQLMGTLPASDNRDWVLAALNATLDPESLASPQKDHIAGFNIADSRYWGTPPDTVFQALAAHLVDQKKVGAELAPMAAHLLLSQRAPEYLVKGIPAQVTYGSHIWASFTTAVARVEAQAPGSTARMTFAQIMSRADLIPTTVEEQQAEKIALQQSVLDWGVVNGVIEPKAHDQYTSTEIKTVSNAFNQQTHELMEASSAFSASVPTRRELALKHLKRVFGEGIDFDKRCIEAVTAGRDDVGPHSVVDLYLESGTTDSLVTGMRSTSPSVPIDRLRASLHTGPNINELFNKAFPAYRSAMEGAVGAQVKYLISKLPIEDRRNIEDGKLDIFKDVDVRTDHFGGVTKTTMPNTSTLQLKVERQGTVSVYEVNLKENSVRKRDDLKTAASGQEVVLGHRVVREFPSVAPAGNHPDSITHEKNDGDSVPNSYTSARTGYIADAFIKNANIGAYEDDARGKTTFESRQPFYKRAPEILVDMIPLVSAVKKFVAGDLAGGMTDLAIDALGFMVGINAAAKGAKALQTAASAGAWLAQGGKVLGKAAIGALNPLDGAGNLISALTKGGQLGVRNTYQALRMLRHTDSYDLIKASKQFDASAIGTFKLQGTVTQGPAVLTQGKWYAFDGANGRPFGNALEDFQPSFKSAEAPLGNWAASAPSPSPDSVRIREYFDNLLTQEKTKPDNLEFQRGYNEVDPKSIKGYRTNMKSEEVMKLATSGTVSTAEVGALVRQQERLAAQHGLKGASRVYEHVTSVGGEFISTPQVLYLSQTNPMSRGECLAMSRLMANAIENNTDATFRLNMATAAANPASEASRAFSAKLTRMQKDLNGPTLFHAAMPRRKLDHQSLITELTTTQEPKTFMISTPDHALIAGVKGRSPNKEFFFYDPNFGFATFKDADAAKRSLTRIFTDKDLPTQYRTHSSNPGKLEFEVSAYDDSWKKNTGVRDQTVRDLTEAPLAIKPTVVKPSPVLPKQPPAVIENVTPTKTQSVEVYMGNSETVTDTTSVLKTNSITDCSAVVVLTDLRDGIYHKRTLMHLTGSNLDAPMNNSSSAHSLIAQLNQSLDRGGKVIFVGGTDTKSVHGVGVVIGQTDEKGTKPLLDLMQKPNVEVTYASSVGVEVAPDGAIKLRDSDGSGVFSEEKVRQILDWAKD